MPAIHPEPHDPAVSGTGPVDKDAVLDASPQTTVDEPPMRRDHSTIVMDQATSPPQPDLNTTHSHSISSTTSIPLVGTHNRGPDSAEHASLNGVYPPANSHSNGPANSISSCTSMTSDAEQCRPAINARDHTPYSSYSTPTPIECNNIPNTVKPIYNTNSNRSTSSTSSRIHHAQSEPLAARAALLISPTPTNPNQSIFGSRALQEPDAEPYQTFQSFFSLPSSPAERGMSFEQMLMANSAVMSVASEDPKAISGGTPHSRPASRGLDAIKSSHSERIGRDASATSTQERTNAVEDNVHKEPIPASESVDSPDSDPASIKAILSVADYIPGTSREDVEDECLDYRLKGRSRVSRGYSADFSTSHWTVAAGSNHSSHALDGLLLDKAGRDAGRRSMSRSRMSTPSRPTSSPEEVISGRSSEMLPLSEFLSQSADDTMDSQQHTSAKRGQLVNTSLGPGSGYPTYNPPPSPPPPVLLLSNQTGRIPITSAAGEFSGFQQYMPPHKDAKYGGHSRMSSRDRSPARVIGGLAQELHLPSADSGTAGNGHEHDEDEFLNQGKPTRNYKVFPGRNIFFCGGRIMTSRDFPAFFTAIMLLLVPTGLFFGFTAPFLWHHVSPAAPIIQAYLFIVAFSSMLKTSWTDPGVIPRGIDGDPPLDAPLELEQSSASFYPPRSLPRQKEVQIGNYTVRLKYCDTCKIYRPPRCSHCRQCDNCVEDEDHHCIWLNNCIGRRNYRYFLIFVSTASLYALLTSALSLTHLMVLYHDRKDSAEDPRSVSFQKDALAKAPASTLVMIYSLIMGLAVGSLAMYHFWLATMNRTTHEQLSASMMRPHVVDNPFDRGSVLKNCAAVFFRPPTRRPSRTAAHHYSRVILEEDEDEEEQDVSKQSDTASQAPNGVQEPDDNDLEIHVRFGEGQDLCLRVPRTFTIAQVKDKVKEERPSTKNMHLRLIHSGKVLLDNKTLIETLPKSLFGQVEIPHQQQYQSRLSSSVEAVEAAAHNLLAGISSRTSGEKAVAPTIRTHTSLGSILPTHMSYTQDHSTSLGTAVSHHPLANEASGANHVTVTMPKDYTENSHGGARAPSTITIPVQTGPIYFLCSLSEFPPAQPPSAAKKGKAVATDTPSRTGGTNSSRRRDGSSAAARRMARRHGSQSASDVAGTSASSPLTLPGHRGSSREGASTTEGTHIRDHEAEDDDLDEEEDEVEEDGDPSPIMAPQPTGFDRLREAGFSEDEIRSIRRQFHASRGTITSTVGENGIAVGLDQDEDASARARRIEEEWIDQHGAETLPDGLEGSYGEMVWGLMLGFFMGLIALFWFKEATFSRRQQMGIFAGLMINLGFGVLHLYY
ncbi:hypothetical protein KVV02_003304 [Mortierella alpina]|uniref:Palmitoyltransferase ERF2 n=1 Tax=Mortierella alpina TaxID=64518 RepID=A0A9P8A9S1_MORAP|nr:hypothetical protein KVV02_003304 [Mortierella alpina]